MLYTETGHYIGDGVYRKEICTEYTMDLEQFKALLKELLGDKVGEVDASIWGQIGDALESSYKTFVQGVTENRDKILSEKKKLQDDFKAVEAKLKAYVETEVNPDQIADLKAKVDAFESDPNQKVDQKQLQTQYYESGRSSMEKELQPQINNLKEQIKALEDGSTALKQKHINALKDVELKTALSELHVEADPFWFRGFSSSAEVEYNEIEDKVEISLPSPTEPNQRIPLKDWKRQFPISPEGKKRIRVPDNYGGGANGSNGKGKGNSATLEEQIRALMQK